MIWDSALLLTKWLSYVAMIATPGALLVSWLCARVSTGSLQLERRLLSHYVLPVTVMGIVASSLFFLLQVGVINQRGPAGMFDPVMAGILADTTVGDGLRWRLSGFFVALISAALLYLSHVWPMTRSRPAILSPMPAMLLGTAAILALSISFTVLGHSNQLGLFSRLMVVMHVASVCVWIGALVPLYTLCRERHADEIGAVAMVMTLFGQAAWIVLVAIVFSGVWMLWQLSDGFSQLLSSAHGRLLLVKLLLVAGLLALGAWHKYRLVPSLTALTLPRLRRSIAVETILAALVLALTAMLTTVVGPAT
ncbi:MAG: hypothetical protein CMQ34_02565 [Gammaproteobacteria bacterium]|nr:hypothetical protein [Gammaproteobacteria bacterium]|tara:strand:+ start:5653 stop:6576 length:924 start_codon:yes stop_codon:yes gene_type:complete